MGIVLYFFVSGKYIFLQEQFLYKVF